MAGIYFVVQSGTTIMTSQNSIPWSLEWNDNLSMGIPEIDTEHQRFIRLVNQLNEAIIGRMEIGEVMQRMRAIMDDAHAHFAHEEVLFKEWRYPDGVAHAHKHAELSLALDAIMKRFRQGCTEYELIDSGMKIKSLLIEHLLTEDVKYRDYCKQNKLSELC